MLNSYNKMFQKFLLPHEQILSYGYQCLQAKFLIIIFVKMDVELKKYIYIYNTKSFIPNDRYIMKTLSSIALTQVVWLSAVPALAH